MSDDLVLCERRADGVAVVTLNNPKVNALSQAVLARLRAVAEDLTANPPGAVVITGGERIFAAGADISEFGGTAEGERIGLGFHSALDAVAAIPATPSVVVASWLWRATTESPARKPCSVSPKCCWASSPAVAARNDCPVSLVSVAPKSWSSPVVR
jgi:hypothetical protein